MDANERTRVRRFEDLIAWQKARALTREIYATSAPGSFGKDFGLRDQIRQAATSIMSNIAEGFERGGRPEFHQFLSIAKGSCAELRSQLYVAVDAGYLGPNQFASLLAQAEEVGRILGGLRASVQKQRDMGKTGLRDESRNPKTGKPQTVQPSQSSVLSPQH